MATLEAVGMDGQAGRRPSQLSGGEQQRVAIARILAGQQAVIFADEPTGALDTSSGDMVLDLLVDAARKQGRAVVMVTHDPRAAQRADRVVFLADGRVVDFVGTHDVEQMSRAMARRFS